MSREQSEIDSILSEVIDKGYQPALRSMATAVNTAATLSGRGIGVENLVIRDPRYQTAWRDDDAPIGDLLFAGEPIAERCYFVQPFRSRLLVFEIRNHCVPSRLNAFCAAVEQAARTKLDGRRLRGMNFLWKPFRERLPRRFAVSSRFPETELKTKKADYSDDELRAARLLVGAEARNLLLQLAQIGKVRAADAKLPEGLVEKLLNEHLIAKEYLVLCKKDSRTLCQVASVDDLKAVGGGKLVCATCGRNFSEEQVQEIFSGTESGKALVTSSRWMSIWLTDLLVQAGIDKDAIAWSVTAGEDEIDIMTEALGLRIFFELKDREFGLGDAYPFAYRVDRYGGSIGVVVSTDRIAPEAEKFFQEQRSKSAASIDTLAGTRIEPGIRDLVDKYSKFGVRETVSDFSGRVSTLAPVVSSWMDMFANRLKFGLYKPPCTCVRACVGGRWD